MTHYSEFNDPEGRIWALFIVGINQIFGNKKMNDSDNKVNGYVYILEVKDIDLPVCKIGMTSRNPLERCREINENSTGDFKWEVAHHVAVDDCKKLESLIQKQLEPLRQKKREFFNITAWVAYKAVLSIIENQSEIKIITIEEADNSNEVISKTKKKKALLTSTTRKVDEQYVELLNVFTSMLGVKGRPFGQTNRPVFGMSDGNEGVQWNLVIFTDIPKAMLGVNLEGKAYSNWPIATFILSELDNPSIIMLNNKLEHPEQIYIHFMRDAWQITARPEIVEQYFGGSEISISEMDSERWKSILTEALGCLNKQKHYCGRGKQRVTLVNKKGEQTPKDDMEVSPHLTISTPIDLLGNIASNMERGFTLLRPVYEWVSELSH